MGTWASSQDEAQARRESGPELGAVNLSVPSPEPGVTLSPAPVSPQPATPPVRLAIPSIDVSAPVQPVGILEDGSQEVPESFTAVGWYRHGSMPGQPGNTVITGHAWSKGDGVFDRLSQLEKGDVITVTTADSVKHYRVSSVGSVELADFNRYAGDIYRKNGTSGVVLMTCGDWDGSVYNATTVVYATLAR